MKNNKFEFYFGIIMMVTAVLIYIIDSSNFGVPPILFICGLVFVLTSKDNAKNNRKSL